MNKRTLKALRGSIKKWEAIVAGTGKDNGWADCPLCKQFLAQRCEGCPVMLATGKQFCQGSPYTAWDEAQKEQGEYFPSRAIHDDDTAIAAVLELEFLRSLMPSRRKAK